MKTVAPIQGVRAGEQASDLPDDRLTNLEVRLENGFRKISEAISEGQDAAALERFWIQLLREYESLSDELLVAA